MKGEVELAVLPPTVTVIGPVVVPDGTVMVNRVRSALTTGVAVPLTRTLLAAAVGANPLPTIVTVAPIGPDAGEKLDTLSCVLLLWITTMLPTTSYAYSTTLPAVVCARSVPAQVQHAITESANTRFAQCSRLRM
ncbi:MAG TPA: hypothetical protein VFJ68_03290 [Casimicrobiaceae bacterium]|nr:hypothetical protein [Casimicrobiaceae bacterium]